MRKGTDNGVHNTITTKITEETKWKHTQYNEILFCMRNNFADWY